MSESADFDPGYWRGENFRELRRDYDRHVGRSYTEPAPTPKVAEKKRKNLAPAGLSTQSRSPLVILCDVTDSMQDWPATIFSKLPYLELESQEYLGKDLEISFGAIGDAYYDNYPLQARPFTKGKELKTRLKELEIERGGGPDVTESYELGALYYARNVTMPNAVKPILIFIGDEKPYDFVNETQAEDHAQVKVSGRLSTDAVFEELKNNFVVYLVRKPYKGGRSNELSSLDGQIYRRWVELLGEDHICLLPAADRVVDVIFGILAKETDRTEYFRKELEDRQLQDAGGDEKVKTVYRSLASLHLEPEKKVSKRAGHSVSCTTGKSEKAKPLV